MKPGKALVTGAAIRVGRSIAIDLAAHGWDVAVHYHSSAEDAEKTCDLVRQKGGKAVALSADLTRESDMQALVGRAANALGGPLTLLVNNASIFEYDNLGNASRESWDRHLESNLRAPFVLIQHFARQAPQFRTDLAQPQAQAAIVNIIDQRVWKLTPEFLTYLLAKSALWTLTQTAAQALAPHIRVNGIGPGPTLANPRQSDAHFKAQRQNILLQRGANPDEICAGIQYILSAPSLTGQMLALDGGQHLGWKTPEIMGIEE